MKKIETIKAITNLVVSVGAGAIVGNAIKYTTPADINIIKKVCIGVGSLVLSDMVAAKALIHAEKQIDDAVVMIEEIVSEYPNILEKEAE